ncbi:PspA-associated protein PspAA [Nocardioides jishulii]|uniref:PspA-associated domain-containing protein n=1 Tax=Nocardioides jishulii TaxID=2575440 RepID=A0A4U2YKC3_9ACTN|nr:hypothetical protein [Nocardioides jishulii]QCX27104.1 hypothetical protein FCL41_05855 [Nocardioides jishulii]TKI61588.1 hypothetical protein FC770_12490 [Nocardioides jishulii]
MIIRILGEGQYDVPEAAVAELNALDAVVDSAVRAGNEAAFADALRELLAGVRRVGTLHAVDSLDASDLILPMEDATLLEVQDLLADDGLIPG